MVIDSLSFTEAQDRELIRVGRGAVVSDAARFVPIEDDGQSRGVIFIGENARIRAGAIICSGVHIGQGSVIGHQCVVRSGAKVGSDSLFSHLVCLERDAVIGNGVRISPLTHITGGCQIGDDVQIGARVVTINDNEMR